MKLHEVIGEGGFGKVKRVTFKQPCKGYREAAAKQIQCELGDKEVTIMSKLKHPNIVLMLGFCKHELANIIILEYAKNGSLHDYLKDRTKDLPQELQHKWMKESARALQYLHSNDYLHRDIKANNCLLFENNTLKLCDFGLARQIQGSSALSSQKGTTKYMAPELLRDNDAKYSKFSDIWAYGMLVYEIVSREMPFRNDDPMHVVFAVCEGKKLPEIPEDCPTHFRKLMKNCWKMEPKERPTVDSILQV